MTYANSLTAEQAKALRNQLKGKRSRDAGEAFEALIAQSLQWYEEQGLMKVTKTPEPIKQLGAKDASGRFQACHEKKAQADFAGTMIGGRAVRFEAKQTDTIKFERSRLSVEQMADLDGHQKLGAKCFVLLCFGYDHVYRVPWGVWREMKQIFGRQYVTEEDLTQYRVPIENGVIMMFTREYLAAKAAERRKPKA